MYGKIRKWSRRFIPILTLSLLCQSLSIMPNAETVKAADSKISISAENVKAKNANNHEAALIVDGDPGTYWQSIPKDGEGGTDKLRKRMYDHNHYIDIKLDGTYSLSQIKIYNRVDGSFNNYYVYASADGNNYNKIISKTSNDLAAADGDSHTLSNVTASYLRLNMAYNSNAFATNLSEIEVYGTKINDTVPEPKEIEVTDWEGSAWQTEWDKFEANENGYADQKVLKEMSSLVGRVLGDKWKGSFRFELRNSLEDGKDVFEIKDGSNSIIVIRGNSGIAMASGFNYYLKNYVNIDYNPMYASNTNLDELKPVGGKVVKEAQFDLRYALNFCTYSYTMSFWNWDEYEEFLDWCAMNGINLVLDIVGQEEVLRQTFREFNYTDEEIKDYICGPAYFAWFYMQNLYSQGGPLPNAWFEQRTELGRKIHDRMQTYGISPVIQAFAGQVPETFAEKNDGAVLAPVDEWSGFTRPAIIKTYLTDQEVKEGKNDYFADAAEVFYAKQKNVFGNVSHYYATDPFHEGGKVGNLDVATLYQKVQEQMLESDKDAIWVMQQWQGNLNATRMSKLKVEQTLPLDLQTDMRPEHGLFETNGAKWIYCMLHNFGGRMGLDGEVPVIASDPIETFQKSKNMVGIGMTPEAMENSPVVYELLFDTNWSKDPIDYRAWMKQYGKRRAGGESDSLNQAWKILLETAYADKGIYYQGPAETVINSRPADSFNAASTWGHSNILYDKVKLDQALLLLNENYEAFSSSPAYKYDFADVAEQVLCNAAVEYHSLMVQAKNDNDLAKFEQLSNSFLGLIDLSDKILSTTDEFMVGTWIEASRKMITDADDWTKDLFEFNARSLITTWGGERVGSLKDYSNRKWSGLTKDFYKERWAIWIRNRIADLKGEARDAADAKAESNWFLWEYQWINRKSDDDGGKYAYETKPSDADLSELAVQAYELYSYTNLEKNTGGVAQGTVNVAEGKNVTTTSSAQSGDLQNITDGDTGTNWIAAGAGPHTVEIDLEGTYDLSNVILSGPQRAGNIPYTWKVEYYNPNSAEWILLQENKDYGMESNTEIEAPANCTASKIKVTMSTSDAQGYPLEIAEITVNSIEAEGEELQNLAKKMTVTATLGDGSNGGGDLTKLTDGNTSSLWGANWQNGSTNYPVMVDMQLPQSAYVDFVEVYFESAGRPFAFYAVVTDEEGQEIEISPAGCRTQSVTEQSYHLDVKKNITDVKVCITKNTGGGQWPGSWPALAEVKVLGMLPESADADLSERIEEIRTILNTVTYGTQKGKYKQEAKEAVEAVLTQAESAIGGDSQTVSEWLDIVNDALENFYETGVVYLDRNGLLLAMAEAKELIEKQTEYGLTDGKEALQEAYGTARGSYETYNLTQADLDAATDALSSKIDEIKVSVGTAIEQEEVAEAKKDLSDLIEQEASENRNKQDYTPESWKEYQQALAAVNEIQGNASVKQEDLLAVKFQLQQAILSLKSSEGIVYVESITLKAAKTTLAVGESVKITADIHPAEADDQTLKWESDNEKAATVDSSGMVTAIAEGTVVITAQAQDGNDVTGTITLNITKQQTLPPGKDDPNQNLNLPPVGKIHQTSTLEYRITASSESLKTVIVQKSLQQNAKKIVIPPTVNIDGFDYKVTEIQAKAFNKNKKITQVTIGTNMETIGKQAFNGCKNLKKVTITSAVIKSIGKKAFAGIKKNAKITVPKAQWKDYKNLFKKAKTAKTVKIKKK